MPDMEDPATQLDLLCGSAQPAATSGADQRPWIGVQFACCGIYARVYRRIDTHFYLVKCPHCGQKSTVRVAPGGVSSRLFRSITH
jgi:hypothetical protein